MRYKKKFFIEDNGNRKLKKKYLLNYTFSPGFYDKLCKIEFYIDKNFYYELFLSFSEYNLKSFEKNGKAERILLYQKSKLPFKISEKLKLIFEKQLKLKTNYYNDKNVFGIMDRNQKHYILNHQSGYFSIDLTLDTLNKELFQTKSEFQFLKFTQSIENWLNKLRDDLMENYGHKKNRS